MAGSTGLLAKSLGNVDSEYLVKYHNCLKIKAKNANIINQTVILHQSNLNQRMQDAADCSKILLNKIKRPSLPVHLYDTGTNSDDDDDERPSGLEYRKKYKSRIVSYGKKFLELFPTCILLAYMHIYDSNYRACYCPCSVSPWHEEDDLFIHQSGIQIRPFQPGKLIHHLISTGKSKQSGMTEIYHYIMLTFMNELFKTCMVIKECNMQLTAQKSY